MSSRVLSGAEMTHLKYDHVLFFAPHFPRGFVGKLRCSDRNQRVIADLLQRFHRAQHVLAIKLQDDIQVDSRAHISVGDHRQTADDKIARIALD